MKVTLASKDLLKHVVQNLCNKGFRTNRLVGVENDSFILEGLQEPDGKTAQITVSKQQIIEHTREHLTYLGLADNEIIDVTSDSIVFCGVRVASQSFGRQPYACKFEWPLECGIQCGGDGIVITGGTTLEKAMTDTDEAVKVLKGQVPSYRTAFFEAFPKNPSTFLRGEGATLEEAEASCWKHYQRILACSNHEFERRNRDDGYCFCKHCGLSGMFMHPLHPCTGCQATEYKLWSHDKNGKPYCEQCFAKLPEDMWTETTKRVREMEERFRIRKK